MEAPVYIVGNGARTAIGLHAESSAAAFRAAISGTSVHPHVIDHAGEAMTVAPDSRLDIGLLGPERLFALAATPLVEACVPLLDRGLQSLPLYLGLPTLRPGFEAADSQSLQRLLAQYEDLPVKLSKVNVAPEGHAAGLAALISAADRIREGSLGICLAGGLDSYLHPATLEWLDGRRMILGKESRTGFVPGEAAGFCLLAGADACRKFGLEPLGRLYRGAIGKENKLVGTEDICVGNGLSFVVEAALDSLPSKTLVDGVYCDQNGERYRGEEWGFVCLRLGQRFKDATAYHAPADCWGDVGAASGPLFAVLACHAAKRGYAKGPLSLLCAGSEGGMRCAVAVSTFE